MAGVGGGGIFLAVPGNGRLDFPVPLEDDVHRDVLPRLVASIVP